MTKIKIGDNTYPAALAGSIKDSKWDNRSTITIKLTMAYSDAIALFVDGISWSVLNEITSTNANGEEVTNAEEWDYSIYCKAGAITDYRDGTIDVKMGKKTETEELDEALEQAYELLYGGAAE